MAVSSLQNLMKPVYPLNQHGRNRQLTSVGRQAPDRFVRFGNQTPLATPVFVTPMVVDRVPPFDANNPDVVSLYKTLMAKAQTMAQPQVSGRRVGAVVIGESGRAYLGSNIEIRGAAASDVLHAEAAGLILARHYGEKGIQGIVQSLQPCGPCRQIILEAGNPDLPLHIVDNKDVLTTHTIQTLVPFAYTYGTPALNLFKSPPVPIAQPADSPLPIDRIGRLALEAAQKSHLPNARKTWGGVAVELENGKCYQGSNINISGPNSTLNPLYEALLSIVEAGQPFNTIRNVSLVEPKEPDYSFHTSIQSILKQIAPQARLSYLPV